MKGRGPIALAIFISICHGVASDDAENDLREFLNHQSRTGKETWDSDSDSNSEQEEAAEKVEIKKYSDGSKETKIDLPAITMRSLISEETATVSSTTEVLRNYVSDSRTSQDYASLPKPRLLQPTELIYPEKFGYFGMDCHYLGQMFNLAPQQGVCLICVCLHRGSRDSLSPICAACDGCKVEVPVHVTPVYDHTVGGFPEKFSPTISSIDLYETTPVEYGEKLPTVIEEASCDPLPEGMPFEHPLNPCQMCICSRSMAISGRVEAKITCQENHQCVIPQSTIKLPHKVYLELPQCQQFPSNVVFPHPTELCKQCVCSNQYQQIICDDVPLCDPEVAVVTPYPLPFNPALDLLPPGDMPGPSSEIESDIPGLNIDQVLPEIYSPPSQSIEFQWPAEESIGVIHPPVQIAKNLDVQPLPVDPGTEVFPLTEEAAQILRDIEGPVPRSPLPGPRPHKSCKPFKSNQPFQHPWDQCQVCVCTEARSSPYNDIEVNCFTKSSCCYSEDGVLVAKQNLITQHKTNIGEKPTIDVMCETEVLGQPFMHPFLPCNECVCKQFGNHVSPVCNYTRNQECTGIISSDVKSEITTIGETGLTFADLQCRFHRLNEIFEYNCQSCNCFTWREYQIRATCIIVPGCDLNDQNLISSQSSIASNPSLDLAGLLNVHQNSHPYSNAGSLEFGAQYKPGTYSLGSSGTSGGVIKSSSHGGLAFKNEPLDMDLGRVLSGMQYGYGEGNGFGLDMKNKLSEGHLGHVESQGNLAIGMGRPSSATGLYAGMESYKELSPDRFMFGSGGSLNYGTKNDYLSSHYPTGETQGYIANSGSVLSQTSVNDGSQVPLYSSLPLSTANWFSTPETSQLMYPQDLGKIQQSWQTVPLHTTYQHKAQYPVSYKVKYSGGLSPHTNVQDQDHSIQPTADFQNQLVPGYKHQLNYKYPPSYMQSQYRPHGSKLDEDDKSGMPYHSQGQIPLSVVKQDKIKKKPKFYEEYILDDNTKGKKSQQRIKSAHPDSQLSSEEK